VATAAAGDTIALASGAELTVQADGAYAYDINGAFNGLAEGVTTTDSFTHTVSDGMGEAVNQTVTITINGVNDGPTALLTKSITTDEDMESASIKIEATDAAGDKLS